MKIYIAVIIAIFINTTASAQVSSTKPQNEFSINLGGGLSSVHYQIDPNINFLNGYTFDFGAGYTFYFNNSWGIYFGAAQCLYKTQRHAEVNAINSDLTDHNGYRFDLHTSFNYNETHHATFLHIPIMLQFQPAPPLHLRHWSREYLRNQGFYAMGGIKASIPLRHEYGANVTELSNAAYYPEMDNWAATQNFAGLGGFDGEGYGGNLKLATSLMLAFETGMKWRLGNRFLLYTGIYFDFG
jgi:hypothetical protein